MPTALDVFILHPRLPPLRPTCPSHRGRHGGHRRRPRASHHCRRRGRAARAKARRDDAHEPPFSEQRCEVRLKRSTHTHARGRLDGRSGFPRQIYASGRCRCTSRRHGGATCWAWPLAWRRWCCRWPRAQLPWSPRPVWPPHRPRARQTCAWHPNTTSLQRHRAAWQLPRAVAER